MRHKDSDRRLVAHQGVGDLLRSQHQPTGGMQDQVNGHIARRKADGPEHLFRVLNVNVAREANAQETDHLLAMDEGDHPRAALLFQLAHHPPAGGLKHPFLQSRQQ